MGILAGEKNRLHKVLESAGIKLGAVVSDIDGVSARAMIAGLIEDERTPAALAQLARGRLRAKSDDLKRAFVGRLTDRHRFVLKHLQEHLEYGSAEVGRIDRQVAVGMSPYRQEWQ